MDKFPSTQHIYEYANTYKITFDTVLKQLAAHCFIYNCRICCKPYCVVCKTYLKNLDCCCYVLCGLPNLS